MAGIGGQTREVAGMSWEEINFLSLIQYCSVGGRWKRFAEPTVQRGRAIRRVRLIPMLCISGYHSLNDG